MTTNIRNLFSVNGVIDTNKTVMENMQALADAAGAFVTFDTVGGLWSVIINRARQGSLVNSRTAIAINSNSATTSTLVKKFGTASLSLTGSSNSYIVTDTSTDFAFGTGDFTVECWVKRNDASGTQKIFDLRTASGTVQLHAEYNYTDGYIYVTRGTTSLVASSSIGNTSNWQHIAVQRSGGNTRVFVNGVSGGAITDSGNYALGKVTVGADYQGNNRFNGYVDEFRVSNTARYSTSGFTPATQAFQGDSNTVFLVHFDSTIADDTLTLTDAVAKTFNSSNIVGPVTISGKGLNEFYNKVEFKHNHKDLKDEADIVTLTVADADLYPNEVNNTLNFQSDLVNNPVQAQYLASIELKQNRLDKIIRFSTDWSALGLKAGDIILMNIDDYGDVLENAYYRIISIEEEDSDELGIVLSITAMEHSDDVYTTTGLVRQERSADNGITYSDANFTVVEDRQVAGVENTTKGLLLPLATSAALRFANSLFSKKNIEEGILPKGFQVSAINGSYNTTTLAPNTWYDEFYTEEFTPQFTGSYIGQFLFDQNDSGARGGVNDTIAFSVEIFDSTGSRLLVERSGGPGTWFWNDYFLGARVDLIADETYTIKLSYINDTALGGNLNVNASWNIFAASNNTA
jgi:hypothetical protein